MVGMRFFARQTPANGKHGPKCASNQPQPPTCSSANLLRQRHSVLQQTRLFSDSVKRANRPLRRERLAGAQQQYSMKTELGSLAAALPSNESTSGMQVPAEPPRVNLSSQPAYYSGYNSTPHNPADVDMTPKLLETLAPKVPNIIGFNNSFSSNAQTAANHSQASAPIFFGDSGYGTLPNAGAARFSQNPCCGFVRNSSYVAQGSLSSNASPFGSYYSPSINCGNWHFASNNAFSRPNTNLNSASFYQPQCGAAAPLHCDSTQNDFSEPVPMEIDSIAYPYDGHEQGSIVTSIHSPNLNDETVAMEIDSYAYPFDGYQQASFVTSIHCPNLNDETVAMEIDSMGSWIPDVVMEDAQSYVREYDEPVAMDIDIPEIPKFVKPPRKEVGPAPYPGSWLFAR